MPHKTYLAASVPEPLTPVVQAFESSRAALSADHVRKVEEVRAVVEPALVAMGWVVGNGPRSRGGVAISRSHGAPVRADAVHRAHRAALWIETGRSWTNNGFLEHLIEATPCEQVDHIALAVRAIYDGAPAYDKVITYLDPVMASSRLGLPFRSVLVLGF